MAEGPNWPYDPHDVNDATKNGALLGWLFCSVHSLSGVDSIALAVFWLLIFAVVGLPIAFLACRLIARPVHLRIMRRPVSRAKAALAGAGISAIIAAISIVIGRRNGYRIRQDPTFHFWTTRKVDGVLTSFGWKMLARETAVFIVAGGAIGLTIRLIIGPGRTTT